MTLPEKIMQRAWKTLKYRSFSLSNMRYSATASLNTSQSSQDDISENFIRQVGFNPQMRLRYPEFLPNPTVKWRNVVREKLERQDMLKRRRNIDLPEFYVGSIMAVTSADKHVAVKTKRFVGICIDRGGVGLRAWFTLRNVVEHLGVEFTYEQYSPLLQKVEVLRLEKRLDSRLLYLRDAPNEYSTFPFDMEPEYRQPGADVPINTSIVKLNPRPWLGRHERGNYKGADVPPVTEKMQRQAIERAEPWRRYDLMDQYRATIPEEEQRELFNEIQGTLAELELRRKTHKRKRTFVKPELERTF